MCFNSITILAHALELCTTYGFEHCWLLPFPCFVNDDRLKMISYEVPTETTNILKNHTGAESPRNNLAGCISSQQHHRPPSFPVCLCICCSLRGRCSYEERQQADRATSTLHSPYDYLYLSDSNNSPPTPHAIQAPPPLPPAVLCMSFIDSRFQTIRMDNKRFEAYCLLAGRTDSKGL